MGNSLYAARQTGLCPACRYDLDSVMHYRLHVPRDRWPASMRKGAPRVEHGPYARASAAPDMAVSGEAPAPGFRTFPDVVDAEVPTPPEAATFDCERCGRASKSAAGRAAHQRHCEVTDGV